MFGFFRRKKARRRAYSGWSAPSETPDTEEQAADTFLEATGGGWSDSPDAIAADGGTQAVFVSELLRQARQQADDEAIAVGGSFAFTIKNIPVGIESPHEIIFGLMMQSADFGLRVEYIADESVLFERIADTP